MNDTQEAKHHTSIRPSAPGEAPLVHRLIQEAIAESPFYCDAFKAFESERLSRAYIDALVGADPAYAMMVVTPEGETAGTILSSPELGAIFQMWSYLMPQFRKGTLALRGGRQYVEYWDNGRFHKISTYARPDNRVSILLMTRNGYQKIALLKSHCFGEDYELWEHPLTKVTPGYDLPVGVGFKRRMATKLTGLLGRKG